jgi:hypothetical protein
MKSRIISVAIAILALFAGSASALSLVPENVNTNTNAPTAVAAPVQGQGQQQGQLQGQLQGQGQGQIGIVSNTTDINNRISNDSRAAALAGAASKSVSTTASSATNGNNTLTVNEAPIPADTTSRVTQRGTVTIKNTPDLTIANVHPTAPCIIGVSAGVSGPGFSFGAGGGYEDKDCSIRETARSFGALNKREDALAILCTSAHAAAAPTCKALKAEADAAAAPKAEVAVAE